MDDQVLSKKQKRQRKKELLKAASANEGKVDAEQEQVVVKEEVAVSSSTEWKKELSVWVGNLSYKSTDSSIRSFFSSCGQIVHLAMPEKDGKSQGYSKFKSRFAFVYFDEPSSVAKAVSLSESLLDGRKLLIKCGIDYSRRKMKSSGASGSSKEATSPTIFVGNLPFDCSKDELDLLFKPFGRIIKIRLATFPDSGKCKGFAHVDYLAKESAERCIRTKKPFLLKGRKLTLQYATAAATKRGRPWENESKDVADNAEPASKSRKISD